MSKRGLHSQYLADWLKAPGLPLDNIKYIDPPSQNPRPFSFSVGRTYIKDGDANALVDQGAAGAEQWFARFKPQYERASWIDVWEGPNEYPVGTPAQRAHLVAFTVRWTELMHGAGYKVAVLCCSASWPNVEDALSLAAAFEHADYIALHEYGNPRMRGSPNCLHYRALYAAWRAAGLNPPPLIVSECGQDDSAAHGWKTLSGGNEDVFVADLMWYDGEVAQDDYVKAWFAFTAGHQGWPDFDITEGLAHKILTAPAIAPVAPPPVVVPPPIIITNQFAARLAAAFGAKFADLHATLEHSPTDAYATRPLSVLKRIVVHHTAGPATITWQDIAHFHVTDPDHLWPGIGYAIGIMPDGGVSLLNLLTTESYHCGTFATPEDDNLDTIGVVLAGDFTKETPTPAAIDALKKVVGVLDAYLGVKYAILGHRDITVPAETLCPGTNLEPLLAGLRATPQADPGLDAWLIEQGNALQTLRLNKTAALQIETAKDGFWVVGDEGALVRNGHTYVLQPAEHPVTGEHRTYFCVDGVYSVVKHVVRP